MRRHVYASVLPCTHPRGPDPRRFAAREFSRRVGPAKAHRGNARSHHRARLLEHERSARRLGAERTQAARSLRAAQSSSAAIRLICANRELAVSAAGVYRRGEIYLRWLQRGSSLAFGTRAGQVLMLFFVVPLLAAPWHDPGHRGDLASAEAAPSSEFGCRGTVDLCSGRFLSAHHPLPVATARSCCAVCTCSGWAAGDFFTTFPSPLSTFQWCVHSCTVSPILIPRAICSQAASRCTLGLGDSVGFRHRHERDGPGQRAAAYSCRRTVAQFAFRAGHRRSPDRSSRCANWEYVQGLIPGLFRFVMQHFQDRSGGGGSFSYIPSMSGFASAPGKGVLPWWPKWFLALSGLS